MIVFDRLNCSKPDDNQANLVRTALKNIQNAEKISRFYEEKYISLNKTNFVENARSDH